MQKISSEKFLTEILLKTKKNLSFLWLVENSMTSETMFAQSPSTGFKWELDVRFLKIAIKAMSDAKNISFS